MSSIDGLPPSEKMHSVDDTAGQTAAESSAHEDFDVSIIWQNLYAESDFICFRKESRGPIERILVDFARVLETGVFEQVVSVNASKHLFCVTVVCTKNRNEGVMEAISSVH